MLADTDQVVREIIDRSKPAATSTRLSMVAVAAVSLLLARAGECAIYGKKVDSSGLPQD